MGRSDRPIASGTVVMAVFIWLWHQGLESLTTLDTGLGSLGLLTGLSPRTCADPSGDAGPDPVVERAWARLLARRHKWIGYASFWLMNGPHPASPDND